MAKRKIEFVIGEYFHIYNRGNSKQPIFQDKKDYEYFTKLLYLSNGEQYFKIQQIKKEEIYDFKRGLPLVGVGAYCLMANHFHILLAPARDGGVTRFMQKLSTGYSMYFNNKYKRTGTLFEGRFKAQHVNEDRYLKYLFSYIHLNPLKAVDSNWKKEGVKNKSEATNFLEQYLSSSFLDYLGRDRKQKVIIDKKVFPKYFPTPRSFKKEIFEWLNLLQAGPVKGC